MPSKAQESYMFKVKFAKEDALMTRLLRSSYQKIRPQCVIQRIKTGWLSVWVCYFRWSEGFFKSNICILLNDKKDIDWQKIKNN